MAGLANKKRKGLKKGSRVRLDVGGRSISGEFRGRDETGSVVVVGASTTVDGVDVTVSDGPIRVWFEDETAAITVE